MKLFNFRLAKLGMAIAWVAAVGSTQAYDVGDYVYVGPGVAGANAQGYVVVQQASYLDTTSAAVQNSTVVTERRTTTAATEAQANMVLSQIADRFDSRSGPVGTSVSLIPQQGGNAGAGHHPSSIWARAGYDNLKEDNITTLGGWKANLWSFALGYDYKFNDKVLAGAALTYSNLNGSSAFNRGNIRDNAYGIVPYLAFKVNPCFDIDLMVGYSRVNKSRDRTTPGLAINSGLTGVKATSSPRSDRWFGAVYANYRHYVNQWNLLARLGYWYATDKQKGYNETNGAFNYDGVGTPVGTTTKKYNGQTTNISRLSLRLQAGFKASPQIEPYAFLLYAYDFGVTKMRVPDAAGTGLAGGGPRPDGGAGPVNPGTGSYIAPNKQRNNSTFGAGLGLNACLHNGWTTGIEGSYQQSKKFKVMGAQIRLAKKF